MCEMKTMCGDGGIRVQPPGLGGGWQRPPRGQKLGAAATSASLLGVGDAELQQEAAKRLGWPRGGQQGGGAGAAALWGAGGGDAARASRAAAATEGARADRASRQWRRRRLGPAALAAENQQREAAGERGRGAAERSLAAVE